MIAPANLIDVYKPELKIAYDAIEKARMFTRALWRVTKRQSKSANLADCEL